MSKKFKITSGVLAGALLLTSLNTIDVTKATGATVVAVQEQNENIQAKIVTQDGKNYLTVEAQNDVKNLAVRVVASNNQTFVFKHKELKKGEVANFEIELSATKQVVQGKKALPKTEVVREKLVVKGKLNGFNIQATINYDVDVKKEQTLVSPKTEKTEAVKETVRDTNEETKKAVEKAIENSKQEIKSSVEELEKQKEEKTAKDNTKTEVAKKVEVSEKTEAKEISKPKAEVKKVEETEKKSEEKTTPLNTKTDVAKEDKTAEKAEQKEEKVSTEPKVENKDSQKGASVEKTATENTKTEVATEDKTTEKSEKISTKQKVENKYSQKGSSAENKAEVKQSTTNVSSFRMATPSTTQVATTDDALTKELLDQLNAYRISKGLNPVVLNRVLDPGTTVRANEFVSAINNGGNGSLHTRPNGTAWNTAFAGLGSTYSEILAYSKGGVTGLMEWWKKSPSHDDAMLDKYAKTVSIKVVKVGGNYYGVQIFSR